MRALGIQSRVSGMAGCEVVRVEGTVRCLRTVTAAHAAPRGKQNEESSWGQTFEGGHRRRSTAHSTLRMLALGVHNPLCSYF